MKKFTAALWLLVLLVLTLAGMLPAFAEPDGDKSSSGNTTTESGESESEESRPESSDYESSSGTGSIQTPSADEETSSGEGATSSKKTNSTSSSNTSKKPTSSKKPVSSSDYYEAHDDNSSYVHVDSDMLIPEEVGDIETSDGESSENTGETYKATSVGSSIAKVIWIPVFFAVASATGLVVYNVNYKRKFGKIKVKVNGKKQPPRSGNARKKKKPSSRIYVPRD